MFVALLTQTRFFLITIIITTYFIIFVIAVVEMYEKR